MATLTATRGLPASGKTTYARYRLEQSKPGELVRLNRDDIRAMIHGTGHYIHTTEQQVSTVQHGSVERLLSAGVSVIVDDTNLRAKHLRTLAEIAWKVGAEFEVEDFTDVPLMECLARNAKRTVGQVPDEVILKMHQKFLAGQKLPLALPVRPETTAGAPYIPDPSLPRAVMVDIDGTVAIHGDRDPYDTSRYDEDTPNDSVVRVVRSMWESGEYAVVFCSGRDEEFRDVTEKWLAHHVGVPFEALYMRPKGDRRRDDIVKLELFDTHIRAAWNVTCVFDDRDRVVEAWRSIGLTVLQVAPGEF